MSSVVSYEPKVAPKPKVPLAQRVNLRMVTVVVVFAMLVGFPVYSFVKAQMNHGIEHVPGGYKVDLKSMGQFRFDEYNDTVARVPPQFRELDGKRVTLEGFMWNGSTAADQISSFQFVYNVSKCCFGGPPLVQERVFAFVPEHAQVAYSSEEVRMTGTLHVKAQRDDRGKVVSLYTMDVLGIEPL